MQELMYLVSPQGELPVPKKILKVYEIFNDDKEGSNFKVKAIIDLRWNSNNALVCTIKGEYV